MTGRFIRTALPTVMLLAFFNTSSSAQTRTATKAEYPKGETLKYETVTEGVKVLRLWQHKGWSRWPEIAILELSLRMHDELHADPAKFFNKYKIFSKPVRQLLRSCAIVEREETGPILGWKATGEHHRPSGFS
jgi:hypothetical protein